MCVSCVKDLLGHQPVYFLVFGISPQLFSSGFSDSVSVFSSPRAADSVLPSLSIFVSIGHWKTRAVSLNLGAQTRVSRTLSSSTVQTEARARGLGLSACTVARGGNGSALIRSLWARARIGIYTSSPVYVKTPNFTISDYFTSYLWLHCYSLSCAATRHNRQDSSCRRGQVAMMTSSFNQPMRSSKARVLCLTWLLVHCSKWALSALTWLLTWTQAVEP